MRSNPSIFVFASVMTFGALACDAAGDGIVTGHAHKNPEPAAEAPSAGSKPAQESIFADTQHLWPAPSNIPVCWEPGGDARAPERSWVQDALAATWSSANPRIQFTGWRECAPTDVGVRITVDSSSANGPSSFTGYFGSIPTRVVLAFDLAAQSAVAPLFQTFFAPCLLSDAARRTCIEAMAVHEFGHALGLRHEQDRSDVATPCDRDQPYTVGEGVVLGPYDAESVMNYCKDNRILAGARLSPLDQEGIRRLYGNGGVEGGTPDPGRITVTLYEAFFEGKTTNFFLSYRGVKSAAGLPDPTNAVVIVDGDRKTLTATPWALDADGAKTRTSVTPALGGEREVDILFNGTFVQKVKVLADSP